MKNPTPITTFGIRAGAIALGTLFIFAFGPMHGHLAVADDASSTTDTTTASSTTPPPTTDTTVTPTSTTSNTTTTSQTSDPPTDTSLQNATSTSTNTATATTTASATSDTGNNAATSSSTTATSTDPSTDTSSTTPSSTTSSTAPLLLDTSDSTSTPTSTDTGGGTNASSTNATSSDETTSSSTPSSTPDLLLSNTTSTDASSTATSTDPTNTTSTDATSTPNTDAPTNSGGGGGTTIVTGSAASVVNLENVINTNVVDSQGFLAFLNLFQPFFGNIDLSTLSFAPFAAPCTACQGGSLDASSTNDASITNNVSVSASTGGNSANGNGGASTIETGNAYAAANILNIANSNFVNSNYLLLVLNNFSQMNGDLILPGADFFANLLGGGNGGGAGGNLSVSNENSANVSNSVSTNADTGGNTATGSGTSTVATGNAVAASNGLTVANSNLTGGSQVFILVRVFGNWNGSVFSTPPGLSWANTPDGIMLEGSGVNNVLCDCNGSTTATNSNTANITNNVQVYALTGQNEISGDGSITTGDAAAVGNTVNIVNTNVVGHNIILALVNVFGDWQGNLAFGQPDLWVGATADAPKTLVPGSIVTYHFTVKNNGTADATDVKIRTSDDQNGVGTIVNAGGGTLNGSSSVEWDIPLLPKGSSRDFTYTERINDPLPFAGRGELTESIKATEHEDDANPADNLEQISFVAEAPLNLPSWQASTLWLKEFNNATATVQPGGIVHFKLVVGNKGNGPASNVLLHETLYNPVGVPVSTSTWALGTLNPGDVYAVTFDAGFAPDLPTGWFISYSSIEGSDVLGKLQPSSLFTSSSSVYIVNPDDYIPKPPSPVILVPPPATTTATTTQVGGNNTDIKIDTLPQNTQPEDVHASSKQEVPDMPEIAELPSPLSCPATANGSLYGESSTSTRNATLTASLYNIFNHENNSTSNFANLPDLITSTLLAFGAVFMKFH